MTKKNDRHLDNELQALSQHSALVQRLAALNRVTMKLARSASVDDLCLNAVKLGINELGFDRLGLFFVDSNAPACLMGTYGSNHLGEVIDVPAVDAVDMPAEPLREESHETGEATILIAEDDDIICKMTTEILNGCGYTTLAYSSARDALSCAQTAVGPIHLLLTDMMMPEMNGQELAEAVLQIFPNLPVLIVSGYVGQLPEQFLNQANVHFLMKPYRSNELAEAVHRALKSDLLKPPRAHHRPHQQ